jgi:ribosomal protein L32E
MAKTPTIKSERFEMRAAPRFLRLLDNWRRQQEIMSAM